METEDEALAPNPGFRTWFHRIRSVFGPSVRLVDPRGRVLLDPPVPARSAQTCDLASRDPVLKRRCEECNAHHASLAWQGRSVGVYRCHAGLSEVVLPVRRRGKVVGSLLTGRIRLDASSERDFQRLPKARVPGGETEGEWRTAWRSLPSWNRDRMRNFLSWLEFGAGRLGEGEGEIPVSDRHEIGQILVSLRENPAREFRLDEVCRGLGISTAHGSSLFRRETGMGFIEWVNALRLDRAWEMLQGGAEPVAKVGTSCGFPDAPYFSRIFRRRFGSSPSEVRRASGRMGSAAPRA